MYKKGNKYKNYRRKLYPCSPGENGLSIIPSNSLLNIALKNHGNIVELQVTVCCQSITSNKQLVHYSNA